MENNSFVENENQIKENSQIIIDDLVERLDENLRIGQNVKEIYDLCLDSFKDAYEKHKNLKEFLPNFDNLVDQSLEKGIINLVKANIDLRNVRFIPTMAAAMEAAMSAKIDSTEIKKAIVEVKGETLLGAFVDYDSQVKTPYCKELIMKSKMLQHEDIIPVILQSALLNDQLKLIFNNLDFSLSIGKILSKIDVEEYIDTVLALNPALIGEFIIAIERTEAQKMDKNIVDAEDSEKLVRRFKKVDFLEENLQKLRAVKQKLTDDKKKSAEAKIVQIEESKISKMFDELNSKKLEDINIKDIFKEAENPELREQLMDILNKKIINGQDNHEKLSEYFAALKESGINEDDKKHFITELVGKTELLRIELAKAGHWMDQISCRKEVFSELEECYLGDKEELMVRIKGISNELMQCNLPQEIAEHLFEREKDPEIKSQIVDNFLPKMKLEQVEEVYIIEIIEISKAILSNKDPLEINDFKAIAGLMDLCSPQTKGSFLEECQIKEKLLNSYNSMKSFGMPTNEIKENFNKIFPESPIEEKPTPIVSGASVDKLKISNFNQKPL